MLKSLKKDNKKQTKKDSAKEKQPKNDIKKSKQEQQEDTNVDLVEINYDQKETAIKTVKKVQNSKLQEKQIDTSNIVIQKKEEKKAVTSWVVNEIDIKNILRQDFKLEEHITDFQSLTNTQINKEIAEIAKKELQSPTKNKVIEQGGVRFAQLQNTQNRKQQQLVIVKKTENVGFISNIPIQVKQTPVFVNTNPTASINFAPLQKTPQQLKEEQLQNKKRRQPDLILKTQNTGWIGTNKKQEVPAPEFKVSQWAVRGSEAQDTPTVKFAPIVSNQSKGFGKKEQQFVYSSKKQQQQRRKAKEQGTQKPPTKVTVDVNKL